MFFTNCFTKKTKMPFHIIAAFSILVVTSIMASNINIEKSFAVDKVSLLSLNSTNSKLNADMTHFYNCVSKSVQNGNSSHLPKFFNNEPTKTEIALCFKEIQINKSIIK